MNSLKDKLDLYYTTGLNISTRKVREDVKEKVLDFTFLINIDSIFNIDEKTKQYYTKTYGIDFFTDSLQNCYTKIFGDWENGLE